MKEAVFLFAILSISLVSAYDYGNFNFGSPQELLENEWILFAMIFLIIFALSYISLSSFFSKKEKGYFPWDDRKVSRSRGAVIVMAFVVALLGASAFVRNEWLKNMFGEAVAMWSVFLIGILLVLLLIPIYKTFQKHVGTTLSILIILAFAWIIFKFAFNPYSAAAFGGFQTSEQFLGFYDFVTSPWIIGIAAGILLLIFFINRGSKR